MTSKEAVAAIKTLLGLGKETFAKVSCSDGTEISYEKMEIGAPVYVITEEGEIPAPEGEFETEDGILIGVREGKMMKLDMTKKTMEEVVVSGETETELGKAEEKMVSAELIDGTLVEAEGEELVVGAKLMVKTETGLIDAPNGDHETIDGKIISVLDGIITEIKEKEVEGPEVEIEIESPETTELASVLKQVVEKMTSELNSLKKKNAELESKFSKFAAEPAGSKVVDRKGYVEHLMSSRIDKLDALKSLKSKK